MFSYYVIKISAKNHYPLFVNIFHQDLSTLIVDMIFTHNIPSHKKKIITSSGTSAAQFNKVKHPKLLQDLMDYNGLDGLYNL